MTGTADGLKSLWIAALLSSGTPVAAAPPALQLAGKGVQIYICKADGPLFVWTLAGPEADLFDQAGHAVAHHFAGPSWRAQDGSTIVGEVLSSSAPPFAGAIPWLVLRVKTRVGLGSLTEVAYVTRTDTKGGSAPASACDAAHTNQEVRVPYSAVYTFFPQKVAADQ